MNKYRKPNLLIVGAAKAGTTTLYEILKKHRDIYFPSMKEPHFLSGVNSEIAIRDESEYFRLYEGRNEVILGDASVSYLPLYKSVIERACKYSIKPKIIIVLRDPAERFFSHYSYYKKIGREACDITSALDISHRVKDDPWGCDFNPYYECSRYFESVSAYKEDFEVLVVTNLELKNNQQDVVKLITDFLGVSSLDVSGDVVSNVSGRPRFSWTRIVFENAWFMNNVVSRIPFGFKVILRRMFLERKGVPADIYKKLDREFLNDRISTEKLIGKSIVEVGRHVG